MDAAAAAGKSGTGCGIPTRMKKKIISALSVNVSSKLANDRSVVLLFADFKIKSRLYMWRYLAREECVYVEH